MKNDLEYGSIYQRHNDHATYNTASPQEDCVHGEEVRISPQTIQDAEEDDDVERRTQQYGSNLLLVNLEER